MALADLQSCSDKVRKYVADDFEARSNRNYSVTVEYKGQQVDDYEPTNIKWIFSAELYEESGANMYLITTSAEVCEIEKIVETFNSDW